MLKQIIRLFSLLIILGACDLKRKIDATHISLSPIFSSGMIIQSGPQTLIFGKAKAGTTLAVSIAEYIKLTTAGEDGSWEVSFPEIILNTPFSIQIEGRDTVISLGNVQAGKIVVIAGDADLIHPLALSKTEYYKGDIKTPYTLRVFRSENPYSAKAESQFSSGHWYPAKKAGKMLKTFKSIELIKTIYEESDVPIGIIDLTSPGSSFTNWLPAMKHLPLIKSYNTDSLVHAMHSMDDTCRDGMAQGVTRVWFKDEAWLETELPFTASKLGNHPNKRISYLRKKIYIPPKYMDSDFLIQLGTVYGDAEFYFNHEKIIPQRMEDGSTQLAIPDSLLQVWTNMLAVRFFGTSEMAGIYGNEFLIFNSDTSFQLGIREKWKFHTNLEADFPAFIPPTETEGLCYNAGIAALGNLIPEAFIFYSSNYQLGKIQEEEFMNCAISRLGVKAKSKILAGPEFTNIDSMIFKLDPEIISSRYAFLRDSCQWEIVRVKK